MTKHLWDGLYHRSPTAPIALRFSKPDRTKRLIEKEIARAQRFGVPFSMLTIECSNPDTNVDQFHRDVTRYLEDRLRVGDDYGRLNETDLAVLLPETSRKGALVVRKSILIAVRHRHPHIRVTVNTYPEKQLPGSFVDRGTNQGGNDDGRIVCDGAIEPLLIHPLPAWKRALDVVLSGLGLIALSPVFLTIAILIRLTSNGPAIYSQQRAGLAGIPFTIYKFRSMVVDADKLKSELVNELDGPAFKLSDDPRVTPIGRFLRKTSLDEIPQLLNVLRGEMSLVGPRPLPCEESEQCEPWQQRRLCVTPGLTCIWQIHGNSRVSFAEWMRMDLQYVRERSFWKDIGLIARTLWYIATGKDHFWRSGVESHISMDPPGQTESKAERNRVRSGRSLRRFPHDQANSTQLGDDNSRMNQKDP